MTKETYGQPQTLRHTFDELNSSESGQLMASEIRDYFHSSPLDPEDAQFIIDSCLPEPERGQRKSLSWDAFQRCMLSHDDIHRL